MAADSPAHALEALRQRDRRRLYGAGLVVNLAAVLGAATLDIEPEFTVLLALAVCFGMPTSFVLRRRGARRLPVNFAIVLASALTLTYYLQNSPWVSLVESGGLRGSLLGASTVDVYTLLIRAIAVLTAFRTFGLLGDHDVVLSLLPTASILVLVSVVHPQGPTVLLFACFAAGGVFSLLLERRLVALSLPNQLGTDRSRRRALPLSVRLLAVLVAVASVGAYGLTELFGQYQPRSSTVERYGLELARLVADLMTDASRVSSVTPTGSLDLTRAHGTIRNRELFEVRATRPAYWRTAVFDVYTGQAWQSSRHPVQRFVMTPEGVDVGRCVGQDGEALLRQVITTRVPILMSLPCAYRPVWVRGPFPKFRLLADGRLTCSLVLQPRESYTVDSCLGSAARGTPPADRPTSLHLSLPKVPDQVQTFAQEVVTGAASRREQCERLAQAVNKRCRYTLHPGPFPQGTDAVAYFLFETRRGYCVHFASALAVCLRTLGISSRVVGGFAPGQWDQERGAYLVRERDAHAWVEAWLPDAGWTPFDPTHGALLAPGEESPRRSGLTAALTWLLDALRRAPRLVAEAGGRRLALGALLFAAISAALWLGARSFAGRRGGAATYGWQPGPGPAATIAQAYSRAVRLLRRRVPPQGVALTPHEYAADVARAIPETSAPFGELTRLYASCRYGNLPPTVVEASAAAALVTAVRRQLQEARRVPSRPEPALPPAGDSR